ARDSAEVVETAFCTFVLSRIAGEIASILDGIPLPSMNEAVKQIEQEVLTTWPTEAISHAENVVYRLSGMYEFVVNDAPEQAEDAGPAEPVSAGKCSTVS
uniref:phage tail assembly chaperone G n=1 Tax=Escherichia coli TaxID=562 RepID=UPI001577777F